MAPRNPAAWLHDIVEACRLVREFTAGIDAATFATGDLRRSATERQLIIAAVVQLRNNHPDLASRLGPVTDIVGFRNRIVHGYYDIDPLRVWTVIEDHLPALLANATALLAEQPPPPEIRP